MTTWHKLELWVGTEEPLHTLDDLTGIAFAHDIGRALARAFERDPILLDSVVLFQTVVDPPQSGRRLRLQDGALSAEPRRPLS